MSTTRDVIRSNFFIILVFMNTAIILSFSKSVGVAAGIIVWSLTTAGVYNYVTSY